MEDEGVAGDVTVSDVSYFLGSGQVHEAFRLISNQYKLELIPLEDDLLSLEMEDVARDIFLVSKTVKGEF